MINVLILSVGRRVELVNCFKNARNELKIEGNIVGADMSDTAPALQFCDRQRKVCRISDEKYIDEVIKIINEENINLVVPTIDTELRKLSESKELIESTTGAKVLISSIKDIELCRNKINTANYFVSNDIQCPRVIDVSKDSYEFPLFIKPLDGSSSINAFKVNNEKELEFFYEYIKNPIVQEFVSGEEYTVDVFKDFNGKTITIVPRKRLAVRGGEVLKGQIDKNSRIIESIKHLLSKFTFIGQITIQLIMNETGIYYLEINPRFGGGAPMSIKAGADSCKNLYKLLQGENLEYNEDYKDKVTYSRFDDSVEIL